MMSAHTDDAVDAGRRSSLSEVAQAAPDQRYGAVGPLGYGKAPVIASAVVLGGAAVAAAFGIGHLATQEGGIVQALRAPDSQTSQHNGTTGGDPVAQGGHQPGQQPGGADSQPGSSGSPGPTSETSSSAESSDDAQGTNDGQGRDTKRDSGTTNGTDSQRRDREHSGSQSRTDRRSGANAGPRAGTTYTIKWGDTLSEIAEESGSSVSALARANGIKNPDLIFAGTSLIIPPAR